MDPAIIILVALAIGYVALSTFLQRKLANSKRLIEIDAIMKKKMAELKEHAKNEEHELMMAKNKELAALMKESTTARLKPTLVILPVFFILIYVILPALIPSNSFSVTIMSFKFTAETFFVAVAFVIGFPSSMVILAMDRKKAAKINKDNINLNNQV